MYSISEERSEAALAGPSGAESEWASVPSGEGGATVLEALAVVSHCSRSSGSVSVYVVSSSQITADIWRTGDDD